MKTPTDIINQILTESEEERATRAIIAKAQRESQPEPEEIEQLSDEQQGYKDTGMRPSDFH